MKVVSLGHDDAKSLKLFAKAVADSGTRPGIYIGFDEDGEPTFIGCDMTWKELAYLKVALDMQLAREWLCVP